MVGRILDRLDVAIQDREIFRDIDDIPLGVEFAEYVDEAIGKASLMLVAIGPGWLEQLRARARPNDERTDFVRLEVAAALDRNIPIIPLLVGGATMPPAAKLPENIRGLSTRNGIPIRSDPDFDTDIDRLLQHLPGAEQSARRRSVHLRGPEAPLLRQLAWLLSSLSVAGSSPASPTRVPLAATPS